MELQEGTPKTLVNIKDLFVGKKGVLFAVPGAFTPGCSNVCEMMLWILHVIMCAYIHSSPSMKGL